MNHSTHWSLYIAASLLNSKALSRASYDPSFGRTRKDPNKDISMTAWNVSLSDESQSWSVEVAAAAGEGVPVENASIYLGSCRQENEYFSAIEVKPAVHELVINEITTIVGKALDVVLQKSFHTTQSDVQAFVYNVVSR